jgi:signal transduction histidine kinase
MQSDSNGDFWYPRESLRIISEQSNVPVYGFVDTYVGYGVVGGYMLSLDRVGVEAGKLALRVLKGEQPGAIPFVREGLSQYMYDWQQLKRWNISEQDLPDGSIVLYKKMNFFEENKWIIISVVLFIIVETFIIFMLIHLIRKQKKTASKLQDTRERYNEIARANRTSRRDELVASLAHELNQPLTAIRSSSQAALRFLKSDNIDIQLFQEILENVVADNKRATSIIVNIRSMVKKENIKKKPVSLYWLIDDTVTIYKNQALSLGVTIETKSSKSFPMIVANKIQLQQVLLNLVINASEAMLHNPPDKKRIIVQMQATDGYVGVSVRDFGHGIKNIKTTDIFNPFYTTKAGGMGMGLAVTKSIILDHGGDIRAENNIDGGATVFFKLPVTKK